MSSSRKKWISYALLLCMSFIVFPMNALHGHEQEESQCHDHFDLELDACHVSIFHNASEIDHCDHKEHLIDSIEDCELCDFVTSRKMDFTVLSKSYTLAAVTKESKANFIYSAIQQKCQANPQDRAPPVTYQG